MKDATNDPSGSPDQAASAPRARRTSRERGLGRVFQKAYRDKRTGDKKLTATWWIEYSYRGRQHREPSGSIHRRDALRLLKKRHEECGRGRLLGPTVERTTFEELAEILLNDYRANRRRSLERVEDAVDHLRGFFAETRAIDITADRVTAYVAVRQDEKASNATINRELAALKRMFRLGKKAGKIGDRPEIAMLEEYNARKGFFERPEFEAVLGGLPTELRAAVATAYITGWRIKSEILTRQRHHLDLKSGWLRLDPGETKNRDGRMFPLTDELRAALERQLAETREVEQRTGQIVPWLFHRRGEPIKSFRRAWLTACRAAGLAGRIPHDFRRTAVRNLERAGVPRSAAMRMVGHRTEAIYRRYAIVDEVMLREGAEKLQALHRAEQATPRTVVPLRPVVAEK